MLKKFAFVISHYFTLFDIKNLFLRQDRDEMGSKLDV